MSHGDLAMFRRILVASAMFAAINSSTIATTAQTSETRPIKLVVVVPPKIYRAGATARVTVESRDTADKAAPAVDDLTVDVTLRTPSGQVERQTAQIAKGQSSATVALALPEAGLSDVHAASP